MSILTAAQYRETAKQHKPSKYRNTRVEYQGKTFDSKGELARWYQLQLLEKAGEIGGLERQRRFPILGPKGELICVYVADMTYWCHKRDRFVVEDFKGIETREFKLKKRLMRIFNNIEITVVRK